jgi:tyrosyl-tRNA synthetase
MEQLQTIAMSEYALDLGIPAIQFLLRLRLAGTEDTARQLIETAQVFIDETPIASPEMVIYASHINGLALVRAGEKRIQVIKWVDDSLR